MKERSKLIIEKTKDLLRKYQRKDISPEEKSKIEEEILILNKYLVIKIVNKFLNKENLQFKEDLISSGYWGVIIAIRKFDFDKSVDFAGFCSSCISSNVVRCIEQNKPCSYTIYDQISQFKRDFIRKYNIEPTEEDICKRFHFTKDEYKNVMVGPISLDMDTSDDEFDDRTFGEKIPSGDRAQIDVAISEYEIENITENIEKLPHYQKITLKKVVFEGKSIKEISEEIGISYGSVKTHLWAARKKLANLINIDERKIVNEDEHNKMR